MEGRGKESLSAPAINIYLFKESYEPFLALLQEGGIEFSQRPPQVGVVTNSGTAIAIASAAIAGLVKVIVAYLKARQSRKVIITTKGNKVVHFQAEGLSQTELERTIAQVRNITVIETKPKDKRIGS
jgi:hypothetical protein